MLATTKKSIDGHSRVDRPATGAGRDQLSRQNRDRQKSDTSILKIGVAGSIITAICCFTPLLVLIFGVVGLSSLIGLLDPILLPALGLFLLMVGYGLWKRYRAT